MRGPQQGRLHWARTALPTGSDLTHAKQIQLPQFCEPEPPTAQLPAFGTGKRAIEGRHLRDMPPHMWLAARPQAPLQPSLHLRSSSQEARASFFSGCGGLAGPWPLWYTPVLLLGKSGRLEYQRHTCVPHASPCCPGPTGHRFKPFRGLWGGGTGRHLFPRGPSDMY